MINIRVMKTKKTISQDGHLEDKLFYRVNGGLAILFGLIFFNGTLLELFNVSTDGFFSEGNILIMLLVLFVLDIFVSWYNEKLSGILLLLTAVAAMLYFILKNGEIGGWILPILVVTPIVSVGLYFLIDASFRRKSLS